MPAPGELGPAREARQAQARAKGEDLRGRPRFRPRPPLTEANHIAWAIAWACQVARIGPIVGESEGMTALSTGSERACSDALGEGVALDSGVECR